MLWQFRERNFILSRFGGEVFGFVHRAFLEYLAAVDIERRFNYERNLTVDELVTDVFGRHWRDPAWQEVLLLITGLINEKFAGRVIDHLLSLDPLWFQRPGALPLHALLAVRCIGEIRKLGALLAQSRAIANAVIFLIEAAHKREFNFDTTLTQAVTQVALPVFTTLGPNWAGRARYQRWFLTRGQFLSTPMSPSRAELLAAQAKSESELATKLHLLAIACLQTSSILDDSLRSRVEALAEDLMPPKSVAAAQSLANVGDLVLHILSDPRRNPTSASEAEYTVRLLSIIGNEEALRVLGDVAEKFSGIDAELMNAWRLFDRDTFASRVIQRANLEPYQVIKETEVVSHIDKMRSVRSIRFEVPNMATFTSLPVVLRTLESVYVLRHARSNIDGLQNLRSVTQLEIEIDHTSIDLTPLGEISTLRVLSIKIVRAISVRLDLTPLQKLISLSRVNLLGDGTIHVDLSPLKAQRDLVITLSRAVQATGLNDLPSTFTLTYV